MGKASRKKRQEESQAESTLNGKSLRSSEISSKWGLFNKPLVHFFLITIVGFIAYSNTFTVPFHFDDTPNIVENYKIKDISNFWPPSGSRWFGFLTFALNYKLGGLDTFGYHIVNLIIHILNAILVYWLVALTFRTPYFKVSVISASVGNQPDQFNLPTFQPLNYLPFFIALLFVSHPIQTQAVTYIVQRFTSLAAFFYLLSLVMYIKARLGQTTEAEVKAKVKFFSASTLTFYFLSVLSAILAMKTKEISFTLPFIIILYEFCFFKSQNYELRTMNLRRLLYLMPFLLTLLVIPLSLVGIDKPIGGLIGDVSEATKAQTEMSRLNYLFTQFRVVVTYIRLLFLPINQNLDYDYPVYDSFLNPNVFLSFLFLLSIFGLGVYLFYCSRISHPEPKAKGLRDSSATPQTCPERDSSVASLLQNDTKRRNDIKSPTRYPLHATRLITFGIFWFFITLSVESSIIPIIDVIFEHRVYLPSVGFSLVITTSVFIVKNKLKSKWSQIEKAIISAFALIIIVLSGATYARNIVWQDKFILWEDVVAKSPRNPRGYYNLGLAAYYEKNDMALAAKYFELSKESYHKVESHAYLGNIYAYTQQYDKAIYNFTVAIDKYNYALCKNTSNAYLYYNRGQAYYELGAIDNAIKDFTIACQKGFDRGCYRLKEITGRVNN